MRKLAHLQRVAARRDGGVPGSFRGMVDLYLKSQDYTRLAASSRREYARYIDRLCAIFGPAPLCDIAPQDVQRFVIDEHADMPAAANMMLRVLHTAFVWAGKRRQGLVDPTVGVDELDGGEHEAWPEHILALALASDDDVFRLAVHLHLYTGQRTGDVCRMAWNLLTRDGGIPVKQQKTGTPLIIPQHPALATELAKASRPTISILSNRIGRPLKPHAFGEWVRAFGAKHGARIVTHGLRRNAVNALLEAECSTAEVSSITGQSLAMVEHYAKERNQARIADVAMLKWGAHEAGTGKLSSATKTVLGSH